MARATAKCLEVLCQKRIPHRFLLQQPNLRDTITPNWKRGSVKKGVLPRPYTKVHGLLTDHLQTKVYILQTFCRLSVDILLTIGRPFSTESTEKSLQQNVYRKSTDKSQHKVYKNKSRQIFDSLKNEKLCSTDINGTILVPRIFTNYGKRLRPYYIQHIFNNFPTELSNLNSMQRRASKHFVQKLVSRVCSSSG